MDVCTHISRAATPVAVLDACVLYPLPLRDTLLRAAERGLYVPAWSAEIIDEMVVNLLKDRRVTPAGATRLVAAMQAEFPSSLVAVAAQVRPTGPAAPDQHVLDTAVAAGAGQVVTLNLKHFPRERCVPLSIEPVSPDVFLCRLLDRAQRTMRGIVAAQSAALEQPKLSVAEVLLRLEATVPNFVRAMRRELHNQADPGHGAVC